MLKRRNRGRKAFVFSMDAIFAIIVAGLMLLACFFYLSQTTTNINNGQDIFRISLDSLAVLEKDGALKAAVEENSTAAVQSFLDSLPDRFCGNITIYTSSSVIVSSSQKAGCTAKNESAVALRSFIAGNSTAYYAKMGAWYG